MINDPGESLDQLLERARAALTAGPDGGPAGPWTGEAGDGAVRAAVALDGRLESVTFGPDAAARSLDTLAGLVVTAVNAALDARPTRGPDLGALVANLREVQEQSVVEMRRITASLTGALDETLNRAAPR